MDGGHGARGGQRRAHGAGSTGQAQGVHRQVCAVPVLQAAGDVIQDQARDYQPPMRRLRRARGRGHDAQAHYLYPQVQQGRKGRQKEADQGQGRQGGQEGEEGEKGQRRRRDGRGAGGAKGQKGCQKGQEGCGRGRRRGGGGRRRRQPRAAPRRARRQRRGRPGGRGRGRGHRRPGRGRARGRRGKGAADVRGARAPQTACDKGCCVNEIVCAHVCAAARKKGVEIHTLMNPCDTTVGWHAQYAHSVELPSTVEIATFKHLHEPLWRLPPALRRKAGRPKKQKRCKSGLEVGLAKKRPRRMTCGNCGKKDGHNKGNCPQPIR
mmetsp:Transcript_18442/g.63496  ORF Transcript_18442/g.63496 Transcript_18442/m.63496 type:complete len:322 (+) Transcript_18442:397-1362(+)